MKLREMVVKRKAPMITIRGVRMMLKGIGTLWRRSSALQAARCANYCSCELKTAETLREKEQAIRNNRGGDEEVCTVRLKKLVSVVIVIDKFLAHCGLPTDMALKQPII